MKFSPYVYIGGHMNRRIIVPLEKTARYMRKIGYSEESIHCITHLSYIEAMHALVEYRLSNKGKCPLVADSVDRVGDKSK